MPGPRFLTFTASTVLAIAGIVSAIHGIDRGYGRPVGVGLVLLAGAAVFALLHLGTSRTRRRARGARLYDP